MLYELYSSFRFNVLGSTFPSPNRRRNHLNSKRGQIFVQDIAESVYFECRIENVFSNHNACQNLWCCVSIFCRVYQQWNPSRKAFLLWFHLWSEVMKGLIPLPFVQEKTSPILQSLSQLWSNGISSIVLTMS